MPTLLLVEDDQSLGATLSERLEKEGHNVSWSKTLAEARAALTTKKFDLALLDLGLPDGSGFALAKTLADDHRTPFVCITALNSAENRLEGYELGAEEFIPKPFHLRELLLRVERALARTNKKHSVASGNITIDFGEMSIKFPDATIERPALRDFKLLELLVTRSPAVVSREEVLNSKAIFPNIDDPSERPTERTIDNSIVRLRQLLKNMPGEYIRSVRGVGYQWVPEVKRGS